MPYGLDLYTIQRAVIDNAVSGDNELVAAVAGKKIVVLSLTLISTATMTVRFESGASGTALTGQMSVLAATGFHWGHNPVGHIETAIGQSLNMELSGANSADGCLTYILV